MQLTINLHLHDQHHWIIWHRYNKYCQHDRRVILKLRQNALKQWITNLILLAFLYFIMMAAFTVGNFGFNVLQQLTQLLCTKG